MALLDCQVDGPWPARLYRDDKTLKHSRLLLSVTKNVGEFRLFERPVFWTFSECHLTSAADDPFRSGPSNSMRHSAPPPVLGVNNFTNAAGGVPSLALLRPSGCDSVVSRLSLPYSRLKTLAVRKTPCSLANSAAALRRDSGSEIARYATSAIVRNAREARAFRPEYQAPLCPSPVLHAPGARQRRYQLQPRCVTHGHRNLTMASAPSGGDGQN